MRVLFMSIKGDSSQQTTLLSSVFWQETAEPDNPFATRVALCSGYDVYGDLLKHADATDMLWLLLTGQAPGIKQKPLINKLAIALANFGPRDTACQASMSAAAGGSGAAACLMAGLAVAAGNVNGARELNEAMNIWQTCGIQIDRWQLSLKQYSAPTEAAYTDSWLPLESPPGFDLNGVSCTTPVKETLAHLSQQSNTSSLRWLQQHREQLECITQLPLSMIGVCAAAMHDLELNREQGEMLYLLCRLPGIAAHALEQRQQGWDQFPFYPDGLDITRPSQKQPDTFSENS
jgi:citrate synthase